MHQKDNADRGLCAFRAGGVGEPPPAASTDARVQQALGRQITDALGGLNPAKLYLSVVDALNFKREAEGLAWPLVVRSSARGEGPDPGGRPTESAPSRCGSSPDQFPPIRHRAASSGRPRTAYRLPRFTCASGRSAMACWASIYSATPLSSSACCPADRSPPGTAARILAASMRTARTGSSSAGKAIAESVNFARDLVNAPPNDLNPVTLARAASRESRKLSLSCRVWNRARIEKEGMNLFLAVNKGSAIEPRMIHVVYKPNRPKKKVVFVGKGLTFDAGGKPVAPRRAKAVDEEAGEKVVDNPNSAAVWHFHQHDANGYHVERDTDAEKLLHPPEAENAKQSMAGKHLTALGNLANPSPHDLFRA